MLGGTIDLSGTISGTGVDEIGSGGTLVVTSGGLADPTLLLSGGAEIISSGGSDIGALDFRRRTRCVRSCDRRRAYSAGFRL